VDVDAYCEVFNRLDREVWLITARAGDRQSGLIATYVSRASLVPTLPRITIGLAKHHFTHELIEASNAFCMHLIDERHIDWVWHFGIPSGRELDKLRGLPTHLSVSGSPILAGALAWLDCRVEARMDTGDRTVFLAEVLEARLMQTVSPLTVRRLQELAPADKLKQLKLDMERDIELDRIAILEWRRKQNFGD
jgi:flavin reductase (DIM6/NTAB) family NADH-FMN oxidoreductase RutF